MDTRNHNPRVGGSSPSSATTLQGIDIGPFFEFLLSAIIGRLKSSWAFSWEILFSFQASQWRCGPSQYLC